MIRTDPGFVRTKVFARDQGVCAACGFDTKTIEPRIKEIERSDPESKRRWNYARTKVLGELGIPLHRQTYWDADHIVPVVKGGGACGIENYRTLCVPCHQAATARLAQERADARAGRLRMELDS